MATITMAANSMFFFTNSILPSRKPSVVTPAGMADELPVGVQVMGARFTDLRCLALAE